MKKILIIQLDDTYFLEETIRVIDKFQGALKSFELTILASAKSLKEISTSNCPLVTGITTNVDVVLNGHYDMSFNLSLDDSSWDLHTKVSSNKKIGAFRINDQLVVPDLWSTFLLTIKASAPFLSFHLQDIYRNILGIKKISLPSPKNTIVKEIVIGHFNESFYSKTDRDFLVTELRSKFPQITIKDAQDVDLISDLNNSLYIGPATTDSLRMGESGAKGIYISRSFQGFNLLPHASRHYIISTRGARLENTRLLPIILSTMAQGSPMLETSYSLYEVDHENLFGSYLKSLNQSDSVYPIYQSHVVLWNFLLNLFDVNLDVTSCNHDQLELIRSNQIVLEKLLRLHDYAMSSVDFIYQESKTEAREAKIHEHLKNLAEIDAVMSQISNSHPMLRPFLDYYRIRKGQNEGSSLLEQIQHSLLTYSEEHHALTALNELFTVTLRRNEVNI